MSKKILMVCLGNICRSPMAQGILEYKIFMNNLDWEVDSAGTSGYHNGEKADHRAIGTCLEKGLDISNQRSRQLQASDISDFDYILAMDSSNYQEILKFCQSEEDRKKVHLIMNFKYPGKNLTVHDPYYDNTFSDVYDLLFDAMDDVVKKLI